MANSLLDRWKNGSEFTLNFHRAGNSERDLQTIEMAQRDIPAESGVKLAVEGDLKWLNDNGKLIFYFSHSGVFGDTVFGTGQQLAVAERKGDALNLEEALALSKGLRYNFDLKSGTERYEKHLERAFDICQGAGRLEDVWCSAFDLNILKAVREVTPEVPTMFISFLSLGPKTYLHQPSFWPPRDWRDWRFKRLAGLEGVDVISTWPRAGLKSGDYGFNAFSAVMLGQKVLDILPPIMALDGLGKAYRESIAFREQDKISFPGDFTLSYGPKMYRQLASLGNPVGGVFVNLPEDLPEFLKEIVD
jgi:hypothetical protein